MVLITWVACKQFPVVHPQSGLDPVVKGTVRSSRAFERCQRIDVVQNVSSWTGVVFTVHCINLGLIPYTALTTK